MEECSASDALIVATLASSTNDIYRQRVLAQESKRMEMSTWSNFAPSVFRPLHQYVESQLLQLTDNIALVLDDNWICSALNAVDARFQLNKYTIEQFRQINYTGGTALWPDCKDTLYSVLLNCSLSYIDIQILLLRLWMLWWKTSSYDYVYNQLFRFIYTNPKVTARWETINNNLGNVSLGLSRGIAQLSAPETSVECFINAVREPQSSGEWITTGIEFYADAVSKLEFGERYLDLSMDLMGDLRYTIHDIAQTSRLNFTSRGLRIADGTDNAAWEKWVREIF
jgi:hypothetical protein